MYVNILDTMSIYIIRIHQNWWYTRNKIGTTALSISWWRHLVEQFSALLALCAGNSPVIGEFPAQRPVTGSFDVYFAWINAWVKNGEACDLRRHYTHYDVIVMFMGRTLDIKSAYHGGIHTYTYIRICIYIYHIINCIDQLWLTLKFASFSIYTSISLPSIPHPIGCWRTCLVQNHRPISFFFHSLFGPTTTDISKLRITGPLWEQSTSALLFLFTNGQ